MADPKQARGYRNRNPGNIDFNAANKWQGQVGIEPPPGGSMRPRFAVFTTHEFGIRALAMLLIAYQDRHGLRTVRGIINRWAPPSDGNRTDAYVSAAARKLGCDPDTDHLDLHTHAHLRPLVEAIITHELGGNPYPAAVIDEGLRLAGVPKPVETMGAAARTQTGQGALSVTGLASAAAVGAPALQALSGLPQWTGVALVVAAAVVGLVIVLAKRREA